jgi:molybdopterin molybdotransferase
MQGVFYHAGPSFPRSRAITRPPPQAASHNTDVSDELISIERARKLVLAAASPLPAETVAVEEALDRVLAEDLAASADVPPFPSSAMDGYAVEAGPAGRTLAVTGESRAGSPADASLAAGYAIRISTGAAVPLGATAVIPQENVNLTDGRIETRADVAEGQNIRYPGEDMRAGTPVLASGTILGPAELGAAVAAGAGSVRASRRPILSVLCTGDELRAPGEPLGPGEIHNSNGPMLVGLARHCGARSAAARRVPDDRAATDAALADAIAHSDLVVISGGVSVGPHDHVKPALGRIGVEQIFWGVALQPGKPTWFGTLGEKLVFGLPGNPVSTVVTFSLFVAPALRALQGQASPERQVQARLASSVRQNPRREQAIRVRLEHSDGVPIAIPNGPQGSHMITSLLGADALALIPVGSGELAEGSQVRLEALPR